MKTKYSLNVIATHSFHLIKLYGGLKFKKLIKTCENIKFSIDPDEDENVTDDILFNNVMNSNYYDLRQLNKLKFDPSNLGIMHTNIPSLNAHHDELEIILSLIKFDFQIKIRRQYNCVRYTIDTNL